MANKEYKDYTLGSGSIPDTAITLFQPNPSSGVVGNRVYQKWTWLQVVTQLGTSFVSKNADITGATKTKITYDSKGLVTAGSDVGFVDITGPVYDNSALVDYIADPTNINQDSTHRFVSDTQISTWNAKYGQEEVEDTIGTKILGSYNINVSYNDTTGETTISATGLGTGDVTGSVSSVNNNIALFDGTTGKLIKDSGQSVSSILASANSYADGLVVGLWDDRGSFDASGGSYPSSGGSGSSGAILKGDTWTISVAGTLPTGQVVEIGDVVRAIINTPGNTQSNWAITQNNIGYVAENQANKATTMTGNTASNIIYLTAKAVYDWATATFQAILVSGTNIKTINGSSILGSGDLTVGGGGIPEPTVDGAYLRNKASAVFSWVLGVKQSGDTMTGRLNLAQGADIASASTTDLSTATGNSVKITGSTTINSFGTVTAGAMLWLTFDSVLTITHSDNIVLENSQNIITARGDKAVFISKGSGIWELALYSKATGFSVNERPNMFFARGHVMNGFGSSHFVGTGSTSSDRGVIRQFEQTSGCAVNNLAISGSGIFMAIKQACTTGSYLYSVDQTFDAIAEAGFNDAIRTLGNPRSGFTPATNNNARTYAKIEDGWDTFIANYYCKSGIPASSGSAVKTGTWSTASSGGNWISKAETNFSGTGMSTVTSGDKITYTMSAGNGRRVAIWFGTNSIVSESTETYGSVSVTLNGTTIHSNVSLNERSIATTNYPGGHYDNKYGVKVLLVDTYGSGVSSNVIEIVSNGGGKIIVDSILELKRASKAPQLIISKMPFLNTTGYTFQSDGVTPRDYIASDDFFSIANGYIDRAVNKYPEYNIVVIDPNKYVRDSDLSSDNVHFKDQGHQSWNKSIMEKVAYDTNDYSTIRLTGTGAGAGSPADATSYYLSDTVSGTLNPTDTARRYLLQRAFKCESIRITISGVAGSSELSSFFLRKNGSDVNTISTTVDLSTLSSSVQIYVSKQDINYTFEAGDYLNVRWLTPTWATNPTQIAITAELLGKFV